MGSFIGHVYPAVFYFVLFFILLFSARKHGDDWKLAVRGSRRLKIIVGVFLLFISVLAIVIEGVGGVLTTSQGFFFQYAHQASYLGYLIAGFTALAEARGKVPEDSWRVALTIAFFIEGLIVVGHSHEQHGVEQEMHFLSSVLAWWIALSFFASSMWESKALLWHAFALGGIFVKGIWFLYVAYVVYSDAFGHMGSMYMHADLYVNFGLYVVFAEVVLGFSLAWNRNVKDGEAVDSSKSAEYEQVTLEP